MQAPELPGGTWRLGQRQDVSGAAGQGVSYLRGRGRAGANCKPEASLREILQQNLWLCDPGDDVPPVDEQDPRLCCMDASTFVLAATFQRRQQGRVGGNTSVCKINER